MATAISAANFKTALGQCYDAIGSGSFAAARKWYAMAEAQNAGLLLESNVDGAQQRRRDGLDGLRKALDVAEAAANAAVDDERRIISTRTGFGS